MNILYTYAPPKNLQKLSGILIALISATAGFFAFPALFPEAPLRWLFQSSGVVCVLVVIFVVARYIMKSVVYSVVENEDGTRDFTVTEITNGGRSKVTVCRFGISNVEDVGLFYIERKDDLQRKKAFVKKAKKEHRKSFNYCPDILSSPVCCITADEGGGKFLVMISPDTELYRYIAAGVDKG